MEYSKVNLRQDITVARKALFDRMMRLGPLRRERISIKELAHGTILPLMENTTHFILGLTACIITLPFMAIIALIIKLDSPGPVIFKQTRIGLDRRSGKGKPPKGIRDARKHDLKGRPFTFYKFRTMKVNARELYPELYRYKYTEAELKEFKFKLENDPRLTRVGRWLRKTSLDELPNFINVIKGDIALVGPRPEIPELSRYYTREQARKFSVKPGVTGLAQVCGRGDLKFHETIKYDIEYVRNKNFLYDMKLLFKTIIAVILRKGAF